MGQFVLLFGLAFAPIPDQPQPTVAELSAQWRQFGYDQDTAWALWLMMRDNRFHAHSLRDRLPYWSHSHRAKVERYIVTAEWYDQIWDEFTWVICKLPHSERCRHMRRLRKLIGEERWLRGELPLPPVMFLDPSRQLPAPRGKWDFPIP